MDDIPTFDDLGLEAGSSRIATRGRCSQGDGAEFAKTWRSGEEQGLHGRLSPTVGLR